MENKINELNKVLYKMYMKNNYNIYIFFIMENDNIYKISNISKYNNNLYKYKSSKKLFLKMYNILL